MEVTLMQKSEQYNYMIQLKYINSSNVEVEIDSLQLQYILIDKNFEGINMPVISVFGSIEKNILDDMIRNINNNIVTLGIYKYDSVGQNDNITRKYFNDRFIYIIKGDVSKTNKIDNPGGIDDKEGNKNYTEVNMFLIQQSAVNNNRQTINGVYHNASMNSLILQSTNYLGKMLLEPIKYDTKFDQIIIPPIDSISAYIKYLNDNVGVFYDTPYRFFIDFDTTYIVSSSGNPIRARNQYIYTIGIDIQEIDPDTISEHRGAYVDIRAGKYTIVIDTSNVEYSKNQVSNKLVNKITVINSKGEVFEQEVDDNKAKITSTINQIMNVSNSDKNVINPIRSNIESGNTTISIVKNDLDASLFTLNKEYIINDPVHKEYNGRYIITQNKQLFIRQNENFIMSTILSFRKVSK
jgi:hypothetical protein